MADVTKENQVTSNESNISSEAEYSCMTAAGDSIFGDGEPHTWDELKAIEERRRAILKRVEQPFWRVLGYWDGTCLKVLVTDALLWLSIGVYLAVRIQAVKGEDIEYLKGLDDSNIDIIGGFLSFFLVLFVNQANTRFNTMYGKSMDVCNYIEDVAGVVACYLPAPNANRLVRYLNAAHAAGYVGLASDTYTTRSFFLQLNQQHKFLTNEELERIQEIGLERSCGQAMRELLMWGIREVQIAQEAKIVDARMSGELRMAIQKFRTSMLSLYHHKDQPIHFFYIHFLSLLTAFYLPLFAIDTAYTVGGGGGDEINWMSEIMTGLIVLLQAVFVIGLRLLGQVMVDPYGDDLEDLSVMHYIQSTWLSSNRILATQFPNELNVTEEERNIKTRETIGSAWDKSSSKEPEMA